MAGHSHAKNIMHRKGKSDAARSKVFSKLAREITVAAKPRRARSGVQPAPVPGGDQRLRPVDALRTISNAPSRRRRAAKASFGEEIRYQLRSGRRGDHIVETPDRQPQPHRLERPRSTFFQEWSGAPAKPPGGFQPDASARTVYPPTVAMTR